MHAYSEDGRTITFWREPRQNESVEEPLGQSRFGA